MPESQEVGKSELAHNPTLALRDRESAHNAKLVSPQNVSFSPPSPLSVIFFFIYFLPPPFFFWGGGGGSPQLRCCGSKIKVVCAERRHGHQRFSLDVGQKVAFHASLAEKESTFLISAFPVSPYSYKPPPPTHPPPPPQPPTPTPTPTHHHV